MNKFCSDPKIQVPYHSNSMFFIFYLKGQSNEILDL